MFHDCSLLILSIQRCAVLGEHCATAAMDSTLAPGLALSASRIGCSLDAKRPWSTSFPLTSPCKDVLSSLDWPVDSICKGDAIIAGVITGICGLVCSAIVILTVSTVR